MKRFLRNLFFRHTLLKISALFISFALWATYATEPVVEVSYDVPLAVMNIPAGLKITGDIPANVRVRVRGKLILLQRLSGSDLAVRMNLDHVGQGDMRLPITPSMVTLPYGTQAVAISPAQIRASLVPSSTPEYTEP